jgi:uncharacterized transporter YbjL
MIDLVSGLLIAIVSICFGLLIGIQIAHIHYVRRLTKLAKRSVYSKTIAPILVAARDQRGRKA